MNDSHQPDWVTVRRTWIAEAFRACATGILETALATFAIVIAVNEFHSGPVTKAAIMASQSLGLIGSLVIIPRVVRRKVRASRVAALIHLVSMSGFALAAAGGSSELCYVFGVCMGIGVLGMAIPLQTHYLRQNYPDRSRGRLFSATIVLRAVTAVLASWLLGEYLDEDIGRYTQVLWLFAAVAALAACSQWSIPDKPFEPKEERSISLFPSFQWLRKDRIFAKVIVAIMLMGIGVLSANALRVDYLINPEHGLVLDVVTVSLITGIIPSLGRILSTFFWGWLFDRMNFFVLRLLINGVFLVGILLYFGWKELGLIVAGAALFGLARGGGEILFNLFVTRFADPEHVAEYMTVHTFFAGIRILAAPFLGFYIASSLSISAMMWLSLFFVLSTFFILVPLVRSGRDRKAV